MSCWKLNERRKLVAKVMWAEVSMPQAPSIDVGALSFSM
jgi:hypothetical protein